MTHNDYKAEYDDKGFIRLTGFLDAHKLQQVCTAVERYERDILPVLEPMDYVLEKDGKSVRNLWRMQQHEPFFSDLASDSELLALIHHCEVIHFSAPNRTDFPRRGLLMVFRGSHTEECPVLKAAYAKGGALAALETKPKP